MKSAILEKTPQKNTEVVKNDWKDVPSTGIRLRPEDFPINTFGTGRRPQNEAGRLRVGPLVYDIGRMVDKQGQQQWVISANHRPIDQDQKGSDDFSYMIKAGTENITIGRDAGNVIIPDADEADMYEVSRFHAELRVNDWGDLVIRDLESTNGTSFKLNQAEQHGTEASKPKLSLGKQAVFAKPKRPRPQPLKALKQTIDNRPRPSARLKKGLGAVALSALSLFGAYQGKSQIASGLDFVASGAVEFVKDIDIGGNDQDDVVRTVVRVEDGDTLSEIAFRQGVDLDDIYAANPEIGPDDVIHPGQPIVLPDPSDRGLAALSEQQEAEQRAVAEQAAAERQAELDAEQARQMEERQQYWLEHYTSMQEDRGKQLDMTDPSQQWEFIIETHLYQQRIRDIIDESYFEDDYSTQTDYSTHLGGVELQQEDQQLELQGLQLVGLAGGKVPVYAPFDETQRCSNNNEVFANLDQIVQSLPDKFMELAGAELIVIGVDENNDNIGGYWNADRGLVMGDCAESKLTANRLVGLMVHEFAHGIDTTLGLRDDLEIDFTQIQGADYIGDYENTPLSLGYIRDVFIQFETDGKIRNVDLKKYNPFIPGKYYEPGPDQVFASLYGASSEGEQIAETIEDIMNGNVINNDPSHPSYGSPYHAWQIRLIQAVENDPEGWDGFGAYLADLDAGNHAALGANHGN